MISGGGDSFFPSFLIHFFIFSISPFRYVLKKWNTMEEYIERIHYL